MHDTAGNQNVDREATGPYQVSVWSSGDLVIRGLVKKKKKNEEKDNDVNMCVEEGRTRPAGIDLGSLAVYLILDTVCCACVFLHLLQS